MKSSFGIIIRIAVLYLIMLVSFAAAGFVVGPQGAMSAEEGASAGSALLAVALVDTLLLSYVALRSRWTGWRLGLAVFAVFYGAMTFMSQIESAVFLTHLPAGMLPRLFLSGVVIAGPFSIASVLLLGGRAETAGPASVEFRGPASQWAWRVAACALGYVVLYFAFGYFVAWKEPAVVAYYNGRDEGSFLAQMAANIRATPWLVPFQFLRGVLWVGLGVPVLRLLKGPWWESGLTLGLLFAALMTGPLLLPNPFMPTVVRLAHFREIAPSNFIFGLLMAWALPRTNGLEVRRVAPATALS